MAFVTFIRAPNNYLYPSLNGEEGFLFPLVYNGIRLTDIVHLPGFNYAMAVPAALGYAVSFLAVEYIPYAMTFVSLACVTVTFGWLALPRYRRVFPSDRFRELACVIIAILPLAHYSLISTLMSMHWIAFLLMTFLVLVPLPPKLLAKAVQTLAMGMIAWSHPMCVTLLPVLAFRAWTAESVVDRRCYLGVAVVIAAFPVLGTYYLNSTGSNLDAGTVAGYTLDFIAQKIAFEAVFGNHLRELALASLGSGFFVAYLILVVTACALGVWTLRHRLAREQWFHLSYFTWLGVALPTLFIILRNPAPESFLSDQSQIYTFVPKIHFLLLASYLIAAVAHARGCRLRARPAVAAGLVGWALVVALYNRTAYRGSVELGFVTQRVVERVYQAERKVGRRNVSMTIHDPLRGGWLIVMRSRSEWKVIRRARAAFWYGPIVRRLLDALRGQ